MKTLVLLVLLCIILPLDAKQRFTQDSTENYLGNAFNYWNKGTYQSPALPVPDGSDTILD